MHNAAQTDAHAEVGVPQVSDSSVHTVVPVPVYGTVLRVI